MKEKISAELKFIFGAGQISLMLSSLGIIFAYIVAFIVGGETAVKIDAFIYGTIFPILFFIAVLLAFIGLINLYLTGNHTMRFDPHTNK